MIIVNPFKVGKGVQLLKMSVAVGYVLTLLSCNFDMEPEPCKFNVYLNKELLLK